MQRLFARRNRFTAMSVRRCLRRAQASVDWTNRKSVSAARATSKTSANGVRRMISGAGWSSLRRHSASSPAGR